MILDYLNFPMLNPHRQVCKYGPHLTPCLQGWQKVDRFTSHKTLALKRYVVFADVDMNIDTPLVTGTVEVFKEVSILLECISWPKAAATISCA